MRRSLTLLAAIAALSLPVPPEPMQVKAAETREGADGTALLGSAQARLAWALIERLAERAGEPDTAVSPTSLVLAFEIIASGADPAMKDAMAEVLGFGPGHAEELATLTEARGKLAEVGAVFQSANRIVFAPSNPPNQMLRAGFDRLGIDYSIEDLSRPEAAAKIDAWVREVTKNAIPEILGGPIEQASFVALNALHFKSSWKASFDPNLTVVAPFTGIDGKSEGVAMMNVGLAKRSYRRQRNFVAVDLPFSNPRFSLVVVTTTDKPVAAKGFAEVAGWLTGAGFASRSGTLALPRFSASGRENLMPVLDALGLEKARHSETALQGLAPGAILSQVVQRAMIDVDEEGAEAAAATAVMGMRSLSVGDDIDMIVDKPFIFALRDDVTGLILLAGYVGHSPKAKVP